MQNKGEADMKRRQIVMRLDVDPEAMEIAGNVANHQGRSKGRQIGIWVENIARMIRENPNGKFDVNDLSSPRPLAAVA